MHTTKNIKKMTCVMSYGGQFSARVIAWFCYSVILFVVLSFIESYILFKNIIAVLFFYLLPPSDSSIYSIIQFRLSFLSYIHMWFYVSMQAPESTDERKKNVMPVCLRLNEFA